MAEKTRADLVEEVARRFGHYASGTATGGSTTTLEDTGGLYAPDDYWNGHYLYIVEDAGGAGAAPEGEERPVTDYVQSTATLTVSPAFSAAAGAGDAYELLAVRRGDVVAMINSAIRLAGETWLVSKNDDSTVDLADDDYDYDLPTDLVRLLGVWMRGDTDEPWEPVDGRTWRVAETPGGQELVFDTLSGLDEDDTIRLEYLARPSELAADDGTLGVGEPAEWELVEFVVAEALFLLHDQAASGAPEAAGFRAHLTQAQYWKEEMERIRGSAGRFHGRGTVRGGRWARSRG